MNVGPEHTDTTTVASCLGLVNRTAPLIRRKANDLTSRSHANVLSPLFLRRTLVPMRSSDKYFVIIGGAPVSAAYAAEIGASAHGYDAARAVEVVKGWMA